MNKSTALRRISVTSLSCAGACTGLLACSNEDTSDLAMSMGQDGESGEAASVSQGGESSGAGNDGASGSGGSGDASGGSGNSSDSTNPSGGEEANDSGDGSAGDETDGPGDEGGEPRFDIEAPDAKGGSPGDDLDFSYIWIANSTEGTVSKIDTREVVEKGRYVTRPDGMGDPSRTSVGRSGDVAVANRSGGIVKIFADPSRCEDKNASGSVESSSDATALTWEEEECVAWFSEMDYTSQRAVAWTQGEKVDDSDEVINEKVWVTGVNTDSTTIDIMLLNGETGDIEERVEFDYGPYEHSGFFGVIDPNRTAPWGAYGGAVDSENNFWFTDLKRDDLNARPLVRVNYSDLSVDVWEKSSSTYSYGITVDPKGRVWTCSHDHIMRFDPATGIWDTAAKSLGLAGVAGAFASGCMMDGDGQLWFSIRYNDNREGIAAVDGETLAGVVAYELPEHPHGVSVDFDGYVWGVSAGIGNEIGVGGTKAFKIDPADGSFETIEGLVGSYTYSDMTGFALSSVIPVD